MSEYFRSSYVAIDDSTGAGDVAGLEMPVSGQRKSCEEEAAANRPFHCPFSGLRIEGRPRRGGRGRATSHSPIF